MYAEHLFAELEKRKISYRNEQSLQDISTEPVVRLILDFLSVLYADREPEAYIRLMELLADSGFDEDDQEALRAHWHKYFNDKRAEIRKSSDQNIDFDPIWNLVREFLNKVGRDRIVSLSSDYEQGSRLNEVVKDIKQKVSEIFVDEADVLKMLARFSEDRAIRIMTIHKSKGLEFDTVILLGIERETFWGEEDAERCAFFVGASRAKRRLVLTRSVERPLPSSRPRRWNVQRRPHEEFMGYAEMFIDEEFIEK